MIKIYVDRRYFSESDNRWVSFESNPRLEKTKSNIYGRCLPCITNLYEQLRAGRSEITLGSAYNCWKVVVLVKNMAECIDFLDALAESVPGDVEIRGRFGSGDDSKSTKVIVFNAESDAEKDLLYRELTACASRSNQEAQVTYHRACADLYHQLLGDWQEWKEVQKVERPEMAEPILERIRKVLFWEK